MEVNLKCVAYGTCLKLSFFGLVIYEKSLKTACHLKQVEIISSLNLNFASAAPQHKTILVLCLKASREVQVRSLVHFKATSSNGYVLVVCPLERIIDSRGQFSWIDSNGNKNPRNVPQSPRGPGSLSCSLHDLPHGKPFFLFLSGAQQWFV